MNTFVLEEGPHGDVPVDVFQKLAEDRTIFVAGHIDDRLASDIKATLILKDYEDGDEKITIFINSDGGDVRSALVIVDTMNMISAPVQTICNGAAMNEAAIILTSGEKGMRYATKNAAISVSQLSQDWIMGTNLIDGKNILDQLLVDNNNIMAIFAEATGKKVAQIKKDFERKKFFNTMQAKKYGLIDSVFPCGSK
jgi:ATP-dependent Clp protease protease subunit